MRGTSEGLHPHGHRGCCGCRLLESRDSKTAGNHSYWQRVFRLLTGEGAR